jgi:hypothetical protein
MKQACGIAHLKTILATGELGSLTNIYKASMVCMMAGKLKTVSSVDTEIGGTERRAVFLALYIALYRLSGNCMSSSYFERPQCLTRGLVKRGDASSQRKL